MGNGRIITIDGPAGAGKSTVGRRLARSLDYLIWTAAPCTGPWPGRPGAWAGSGRPGALAACCRVLSRSVRADAGFHLLIDGRESPEELRTPEVSPGRLPGGQTAGGAPVGQGHLRQLARDGGVVAEGRDQGSVVFPEAGFKFYLDAALATRAARRQRDWQGEGMIRPSLHAIRDMAARDRRDQTRTGRP